MLQNAPEIMAPLGHQRGADLAQPHAMPPSGADQSEGCGRAAFRSFALDDEGRAVKMRRRERATDFKLLADNHSFALAHDAQPDDAARSAALYGLDFMNCSEIYAEFRSQQLPQLILRQPHAPAIKISSLLIEIGQYFS